MSSDDKLFLSVDESLILLHEHHRQMQTNLDKASALLDAAKVPAGTLAGRVGALVFERDHDRQACHNCQDQLVAVLARAEQAEGERDEARRDRDWYHKRIIDSLWESTPTKAEPTTPYYPTHDELGQVPAKAEGKGEGYTHVLSDSPTRTVCGIVIPFSDRVDLALAKETATCPNCREAMGKQDPHKNVQPQATVRRNSAEDPAPTGEQVQTALSDAIKKVHSPPVPSLTIQLVEARSWAHILRGLADKLRSDAEKNNLLRSLAYVLDPPATAPEEYDGIYEYCDGTQYRLNGALVEMRLRPEMVWGSCSRGRAYAIEAIDSGRWTRVPGGKGVSP